LTTAPKDSSSTCALIFRLLSNIEIERAGHSSAPAVER